MCSRIDVQDSTEVQEKSSDGKKRISAEMVQIERTVSIEVPPPQLCPWMRLNASMLKRQKKHISAEIVKIARTV